MSSFDKHFKFANFSQIKLSSIKYHESWYFVRTIEQSVQIGSYWFLQKLKLKPIVWDVTGGQSDNSFEAILSPAIFDEKVNFFCKLTFSWSGTNRIIPAILKNLHLKIFSRLCDGKWARLFFKAIFRKWEEFCHKEECAWLQHHKKLIFAYTECQEQSPWNRAPTSSLFKKK